MTDKIVGIYRDISQLIIGAVVEDTEEKLVLRRALLLTVEKDPNNPGVRPRFYPISLLTTDPIFHVVSLLDDQSLEFPVTFWKKQTLTGTLELSKQIKDLYEQKFMGELPGTPVESTHEPTLGKSIDPKDNIIQLYDPSDDG